MEGRFVEAPYFNEKHFLCIQSSSNSQGDFCSLAKCVFFVAGLWTVCPYFILSLT